MSSENEQRIRIPRKVEAGLKAKMKQNAMDACREYVKALASCADGKYASLLWSCGVERTNLKACVNENMNDEILSRLKREYVLTKLKAGEEL